MEPLEQEMSPCPQPSQREEGATMPSSKRQSRSRLLSQFSEHSLHAPQLPQVAVEFHPEVELQGAAPPAAAILSSIHGSHLSKFRVDRVLPSIPSTAQS